MIYLNHASYSPLPEEVERVVVKHLERTSHEGLGDWAESERRLEAVRRRTADFIGAEADEIAFIPGTGEGLTLLAHGLLWKPGDRIVVEEATFPANYWPWRYAERFGARVERWPERDHRFELEDLERMLRDGGVRLVSVMAVHWITGRRMPLAEIGRLCSEHGALFCLDAIQALGQVPVDVRASGVDFLAAGARKWLRGPEGAGLLFAARDKQALLDELIFCWGAHEGHGFGREEGAARLEPVIGYRGGILGMGESLRILGEQEGLENIERHAGGLASRLHAGLTEAGWEVISPPGPPEGSAIVSARPPGGNAKEIQRRLQERAIVVSEREGYLRFSPHYMNAEEEVHAALEALRD